MGEQAAAPSLVTMLVPFGMMFLIFYMLVFRPQSKAKKEHELMVKNLKKNDEVVTTGGLYGTIVNTKPDAVTLRIDENVRVDIEPSAVVRLVKRKAAGETLAAAEKAR